MNQLSAALTRARSSLDHVNRLLDRLPRDDERRYHSEAVAETVIHGHGNGPEPERESDGGPQPDLDTTPETEIDTHVDTTDGRNEGSEFHAASPVIEEQSMQPIKKVGLLC